MLSKQAVNTAEKLALPRLELARALVALKKITEVVNFGAATIGEDTRQGRAVVLSRWCTVLGIYRNGVIRQRQGWWRQRRSANGGTSRGLPERCRLQQPFFGLLSRLAAHHNTVNRSRRNPSNGLDAACVIIEAVKVRRPSWIICSANPKLVVEHRIVQGPTAHRNCPVSYYSEMPRWLLLCQ